MSKITRVVLATHNSHKLEEISAIFASLPLQLERLPATAAPVAETGLTFIENALLKARYASQITGFAAIADDSGLEVDALHGAPGVYSARFAGEHASDAANNAKLLQQLMKIPPEQRTARYQCCIAWVRHPEDPTPILCQGTWEGMIVERARGAQGFGYDPLFQPQGLSSTAAELDPAVKNLLSHRGIALQKLKDQLGSFLQS